MFVALEDNFCLKREEREIHLQEGGKKLKNHFLGLKYF